MLSRCPWPGHPCPFFLFGSLMARPFTRSPTGLASYWVFPVPGLGSACPHGPRSFHPPPISRFQASNHISSYALGNILSRRSPRNFTSCQLGLFVNARYSTRSSPLAPLTPWTRLGAVLALILGLGSLSLGPVVSAFESIDASDTQKPDAFNDPLDALLPGNLNNKTAHILQKSTNDLLRSYLTTLMCEIPGVATYGPALLDGCIKFRDHVPVVGPIVWSGLEWIIYNTFFTHYVGGQSIQSCQPVIESMYNRNIGALLNYSVEATNASSASDLSSTNCLVCDDSLDSISQAVETLADCSIASGKYEVGSAKMKPVALAIKISGLVNDPYIFKRASENLASNHLSPFSADGEIFPSTPNRANQSDPLSESDHAALQNLMSGLRSVCRKAKAADIVLMMDAEYSWFQPALDRIVTFLSAEFNQVQRNEQDGPLKFCSPTVFNTFQTLLRSTPDRLDAFLNDSEKRGYSIGIKLVRGAYLISETNHWQEQKSKGKLESSEPLPVWSSKSETDECFDTIASSLVSRLSESARRAARSRTNKDDALPANTIETSLMIAGHNSLSVLKVLKQLREKEGLAVTQDFMGEKSLHLSNSLRGRLMFAQLYGMADNLTTTLAQVLAPSDSGEKQLQPFVLKYLPFGPVEKVLPYLARRAEENQSILQSREGHESPLTLERRLHGKEIRRRFTSLISFS